VICQHWQSFQLTRMRQLRRIARVNLFLPLLCCSILSLYSLAAEPAALPALSRAVRPWEFLSATGTRAAILGNEAGTFEGWVYPLKVFRDFRLIFHVSGGVLTGDSLARSVTVRPESCSILYASNDFQVRETLIVPVHEAGAIFLIEVDTSQPLEVEVRFRRDFQLEWPAGLGGTYISWDPKLHAFSMGEEQKKFAALVGSPSAALASEEYFSNSSSSSESSFLLGPTHKGKDTKVVVLSGSVNGPAEAQQTFERLLKNYSELWRDSAEYYRQYLDRTVSLELPDAKLQQAYDWARISMAQGLVNNPYLGTGLVAGYRTSGEYARPGFAWFFGRDALWTSLALDAEGDFATTRTALDFLSQYQRADGKIPHEIAQTATLVPWFKDYPYAYAAADATPLYLVSFADYLTESGDQDFASQKWEHLWRAYEFLKSTYGANGLPRNAGVGHGWVEGGPLVPVETELYQSALGAEALRSLAEIARVLKKEEVARQLETEFAQQEKRVNQSFWSKNKGIYAFALDQQGNRVDVASVLAAVPMWFGLLDGEKSEAMIDRLAAPNFNADWGMRIISSDEPLYDPAGYHFGSVWPLFTGWAAVGEYRYHRSVPAYADLRANALLTLDGALGHVTEVLSGAYYQPLSTSSPHQIWSAAMVVSPILRGMLGLETNAGTQQVRFAPHLPADWHSLQIHGLHLGDAGVDLWYQRSDDEVVLELRRSGSGNCTLEFSPALSVRAEILSAELNGRPIPMHVLRTPEDQHATFRFPIYQGRNTLRIRVRNDFGIAYVSDLPALAASSNGLRIISQSWSPETLTINVSGVPGEIYELLLMGAKQVTAVDGAEIVKEKDEITGLRIQLAGVDRSAYVSAKVVLHFGSKNARESKNR
jgi:glycogen debranching enzyme